MSTREEDYDKRMANQLSSLEQAVRLLLAELKLGCLLTQDAQEQAIVVSDMILGLYN